MVFEGRSHEKNFEFCFMILGVLLKFFGMKIIVELEKKLASSLVE